MQTGTSSDTSADELLEENKLTSPIRQSSSEVEGADPRLCPVVETTRTSDLSPTFPAETDETSQDGVICQPSPPEEPQTGKSTNKIRDWQTDGPVGDSSSPSSDVTIPAAPEEATLPNEEVHLALTTRTTNKMPRLHPPAAGQKTGLHCCCLHSLMPWLSVPLNTASFVQGEHVPHMTLTVHWLGQDTSSSTRWNKPEPSSVSAAYLPWGKMMRSHAWARWKLLLKARRVTQRSLAEAAEPLEPETTYAASANKGRHPSNHRSSHSRLCV